MSVVKENMARVREEIDRAAGASGSVAIVGVTKSQSLEQIRIAVEDGIGHLGNNYAQDGDSLIDSLGESAVKWHFIGHVQTRKVKYLTRYGCLQSLDRLEIAEMLNRRLEAADRTVDALVEINIGGETAKSGIAPDELDGFLEALREYPRLLIRGLMAMPPALNPVSERRPFFQRMRKLFDAHRQDKAFDCLSMGTSDDYLIAVGEGATMVRLGTVLFGPRPAKLP